MTDTPSCVWLDGGSPAGCATTAAVMQISRRGEDLVEDNHVVLPTSAKADTVPTPKHLQAQVTQLDDTLEAASDPAIATNGKNPRPSSPEIKPRQPDHAHYAALRRLNSASSNHRRVHQSIDTGPSSSSVEPVLVCSYTNTASLEDSSRKSKMRNKRRSRIDEKSCELPLLENFSFQDILASIDSDVKESIDAIAEICGRSRMSLADQYGSHLPPQGELTSLLEHGDTQIPQSGNFDLQQESISTSQANPNRSQHHDRGTSASLSLVGNLYPRTSGPSSAPVVATAGINSQSVPNSFTYDHIGATIAPVDTQPTLLPHVLSWLRPSNPSLAAGGHDVAPAAEGDQDPAAQALHRILRRIGKS